jgi:uncharacterized protein YukE
MVNNAEAAADAPSIKGHHAHPAMGGSLLAHQVAELEVMTECAGDIYDLAKGNNWKGIPRKLHTLKKYNLLLTAHLTDDSTMLLPKLNKSIIDLDQSIYVKNRMETMRNANKITLVAATIAGTIRPAVPKEILLLDHLGHELEIWAEAKNMDKLSGTVAKMHLTWQNLMPQLIDKCGGKGLRRFSETMKRLETAKTPDEYGRLAAQVLDEVDGMEKVFQ